MFVEHCSFSEFYHVMAQKVPGLVTENSIFRQDWENSHVIAGIYQAVNTERSVRDGLIFQDSCHTYIKSKLELVY